MNTPEKTTLITLLTLTVLALYSACSTAATPPRSIIEPKTGMEFIHVEGGCFHMGNVRADGWDKEVPSHDVCVDSFYLGKYEVTQGQYEEIMDSNPSNNASFWRNTDDYPVIQVSWNDTQMFIEKLNATSEYSFRLPTEAEWEFAARSGGRKEKFSGSDTIDEVAWYKLNSDPEYDPEEWLTSEQDYFQSEDYFDNYQDSLIHPVGQKKANGLGIFDMSGNAYEWCQDYYDETYYQRSPKDNPQGPANSAFGRVLRGGSWYSEAFNARTTYRMRQEETFRNFTTGFRLVLIPNKL